MQGALKNYSTGTDNTITVYSPVTFSKYIAREIGVQAPIGQGRRLGFYKFVSQEMREHGWSWDDLRATVDYIKTRRARVRSQYGVLHFVSEALDAQLSRDAQDVSQKVSEAVEVESDDRWRRRLATAKGPMMDKIYDAWLKERGELYGL